MRQPAVCFIRLESLIYFPADLNVLPFTWHSLSKEIFHHSIFRNQQGEDRQIRQIGHTQEEQSTIWVVSRLALKLSNE